MYVRHYNREWWKRNVVQCSPWINICEQRGLRYLIASRHRLMRILFEEYESADDIYVAYKLFQRMSSIAGELKVLRIDLDFVDKEVGRHL